MLNFKLLAGCWAQGTHSVSELGIARKTKPRTGWVHDSVISCLDLATRGSKFVNLVRLGNLKIQPECLLTLYPLRDQHQTQKVKVPWEVVFSSKKNKKLCSLFSQAGGREPLRTEHMVAASIGHQSWVISGRTPGKPQGWAHPLCCSCL